jgi:hypothetical protein
VALVYKGSFVAIFLPVFLRLLRSGGIQSL